jgi:hypothetical protein
MLDRLCKRYLCMNLAPLVVLVVSGFMVEIESHRAFGADFNPADCHDMECWDQSGQLWRMAQKSGSGCEMGMPCSLSPEDALRQAYKYCRQYFWDGAECGPRSICVMVVPHYTDPKCDDIAKRWKNSAWKKADDAADARVRQQAIDHAKAFIDAIEKGAPRTAAPVHSGAR